MNTDVDVASMNAYITVIVVHRCTVVSVSRNGVRIHGISLIRHTVLLVIRAIQRLLALIHNK